MVRPYNPVTGSPITSLFDRLVGATGREGFASGAVSMHLREGNAPEFGVPYLSGRRFETYEEAREVAARMSLVESGGFSDVRGYKEMGLSHFDDLNTIDSVRFRRSVLSEVLGDADAVAQMTDEQVMKQMGANLEVFRFNLGSGRAMRFTQKLMDKFDNRQTILFQDESKMMGMRVQGLQREGLLRVLEDFGFEFDPSQDKFMKRAKTLTGPKQIDLGFADKTRNLRAAVFDPLNLPDAMMDELAGVHAVRERETAAIVDKIIRGDTAGQLRMLQKEFKGVFGTAVKDIMDLDLKTATDEGVDVVRKIMNEDLAEKIASRVVKDQKALMAFDGANILAREVVQDAIKDTQSKIAGRPRNREHYERILRQLQQLDEQGTIANIRLSGDVFDAINDAARSKVDLTKVLQSKGNIVLAARARIMQMAGASAGGDPIDILVPTTNIAEGAGVSERGRNILTLEPHFTSPVYADRTSVSSGLITKEHVQRSAEELRQSIDELATAVARGKPIEQGSRVYHMFESVLEQTRRKPGGKGAIADEIVRQMEETGAIPEIHMPRAIKMFRESLTKNDQPRMMLPGVLRSSMMSEDVMRVAGQMPGGAKPLMPGETAFTKHASVRTASDIFATYHAHGGPDLDDTMQHILQYDPHSQSIYTQDYRNPVTGDEVSRMKVRDGLYDTRIRRMLQGTDTYREQTVGLRKAQQLFNALQNSEMTSAQELELINQITTDNDVARLLGGSTEGLARTVGGRPVINRTTADYAQMMLERVEKQALSEAASEVFAKMDVVPGRGFKYTPKGRELLALSAMTGQGDALGGGKFTAEGVDRILGGRVSKAELSTIKEQLGNDNVFIGKVEEKAVAMFDDVWEGALRRSKDAHVLGSWVNAKGFLDNFLNLNVEELAGADPELVKSLLAVRKELVTEEAIIDITRSGPGLTEAQSTEVQRRITNIYESVLDVVGSQGTDGGLRVSRALFDRMPKGVRGRTYVEENAARFLSSEDAYSFITDKVTSAQALLEELETQQTRKLFADVELTKMAQEEVREVTDLLDDAGRVYQGDQETARKVRSRILREQVYERMEYTGEGLERRVGRRSAEFFVGMARGRYGAYMPHVAEMGDLKGIIRGEVDAGLTGKMLAEQMGRYPVADDLFRRELRNVLGNKLHDDLSLLGEMYTGRGYGEGEMVHVGKSILGFTAEGDISPHSVIAFGDEFAYAGEVAARPEEVARRLGFASEDSIGVDEMRAAARAQMDEGIMELYEQLDRGVFGGSEKTFIPLDKDAYGPPSPQELEQRYREGPASAYEPDRYRPPDAEGPYSRFREAVLKKEGFVDEMRDALKAGGVTKKIGVGFLAVIAGSMMYNSIRDKQHEKNMQGIPETMPMSNSPYDMNLAMPERPMMNMPTHNAPVYQIRTRGGQIDDSFINDLRDLTGSDVDAFLFRDTLRTDAGNVTDSILESYR